MSYSNFSIDSLESSTFLNSNDNIKYFKQNTISNNNEWQLIESIDVMSVPLYSGPVSLQELKRIEVNGNKILELETKEFSNIKKKKCLSSTTNKSWINLKNFKHPKKQEKNYNPRVFMNIDKIEQMK
ncbi:uncharacterized protein LOC112594466 [Melanaphis sacchari]|uniref:uncharacterized protein LOC112594466 n=1 Tax=Melanaphis sacchari TaxID=742174 RepID=UPI000DC146B4|nr:uncharacterized protein LOC112594466 [Melanaphis sacchari]